jgi:two-component system, OmpR family, sensor kinase
VNSLRIRLLAAFAYVLVLVLVALAVPFALNVSDRVETEVESQAASQTHLIAASVTGRLDEPAALQQIVRRAGGDVQGRVVVVGARGRLLADSAGSGLVGASYADRPEIRAALAEGTIEQGRRRSETLDDELLYTAVPVVQNGRPVGAVRVTRSVAPIDDRVWRDRLAVAGIAAAALTLGLALAWLLAGSLARPLRGLATTARRIGAGDLGARAEVTGSAEHREVAAAFNDMASRLARVLEAQREFVANASHQLRTPLTGLRLRLESAALRTDDPELERDLAAAERETVRLTQLLTALLTLAREGGEPAAPRPVDIAAAADLACDRWRAEAEGAGRRLLCGGASPVWASASDDDVAIVLDNLIENALRYSPPGTDVEVEWAARGGVAVVAVLDRGPGFADEEVELVFERFARGSASRAGAPGTGLGLAVVRTLARRWGGDAAIGARPGGGSRVELTLPATAAAGERATATEVPVG